MDPDSDQRVGGRVRFGRRDVSIDGFATFGARNSAMTETTPKATALCVRG